MPGIIERILRFIIKRFVERLVCQHFCAFSRAGSDLIYTHVHLKANNPEGVSGLGHDDHTGVSDDGHVTISRGGEITIQAEDEASMALREGYLSTAYFHQGDDDGTCPAGFTAVRCTCSNGEDGPREVWVCYTTDYHSFRHWYEERRWPHRVGDYAYPYIYAGSVTPDRPGEIGCDETVTIHHEAISRVFGCDGYGADDADNPLVMEARRELQAAAAMIRCEQGCHQLSEETFSGWRCRPNATDDAATAEAVVQWTVGCERY